MVCSTYTDVAFCTVFSCYVKIFLHLHHVVFSGSIKRATDVCQQLETICRICANDVALSTIEASQIYCHFIYSSKILKAMSCKFRAGMHNIHHLGRIPPHHPCLWINWPTLNTNHVIKAFIHKVGVKTACRIAVTVQHLPQTSHLAWQATKCCTPGLCLGLPTHPTLPSNLWRSRMQTFVL